jgi:GNAT superfamily N-acetyltransferase
VNGKTAGYFTYRDAPYAFMFPGKEVVQLYEMILHPDYRGLGYGAQALDTVITMFSEETMLTAHIRPASSDMRWMLKRRNFRDTGFFGGVHVLVRGNGSDAAKLARRLKKVTR